MTNSRVVDNRTPPLIQVHDFAGHPFQAELSRALARRGYTVQHLYCSQYGSGKGRLERHADDPESLSFVALAAGVEFDKYSPWARLRFERAYAAVWQAQVMQTAPDCVIVCNMPLLALDRFVRWARRRSQSWVLWHQDIFSLAMGDELARRLPGSLAGGGRWLFARMEARAVRSASRVVAIGDAFTDCYREWGLDTSHVDVIPNWAPIKEVLPADRDNSWARTHLPPTPLQPPLGEPFGQKNEQKVAQTVPPAEAEGMRLVYAGTLGRKHNPRLLLDVVDRMQATGGRADLVVVSEGDGADEVRMLAAQRPGVQVTVLPFQPAEDLPDVLAAGDVLVAILEPDASLFSIPSKVLTYLAAGRPVLALMPAHNPAAGDVETAGGFVASPDADGVGAAVDWLHTVAASPGLRDELGMRSRKLAEEKFGIEPIADRFIAVLDDAMRR